MIPYNNDILHDVPCTSSVFRNCCPNSNNDESTLSFNLIFETYDSSVNLFITTDLELISNVSDGEAINQEITLRSYFWSSIIYNR